MHIRHPQQEDYYRIITVVNDWWGGRSMTGMLPKLFFIHFRDTSFIAEVDGEIIGFLVGFLSQTYPEEAYVHFLGVHPDFRKQGVALTLYEHFLNEVRKRGRKTVRLVTVTVNKESIAFHLHIGFEIEPQETKVDGIPFYQNYDGLGGDRVLFVKRLSD
ncbi:MAG: GNAT family N-acetyltransferase [Candidatus Bathyarchaeia archaeon]|jgi:ribosomal protein S18 acetylase RimI-like enzyme